MAGVTGTLRLSGNRELESKLFAIEQKMRTKIVASCVRKAAKPKLSAMKSSVPVETGLLKKSLGLRVKTYRNSKVTVAAIGPRHGHKSGGRNPVKYAHLVEGGTKPHNIKTLRLPSGKIIKRNWKHPGTKAVWFMRNTRNVQAASVAAFESELRSKLATL